MKGYIHSRVFEKDPNGFGTWIHVDFTSKREAAYSWSAQQDAANEAGMLESHDIAVRTTEGQRHVCKGYQVEERSAGEFVVWVDAPFNGLSGTDKPDPTTAA